MSDGEVDIRLLALRRHQKKNQSKSSTRETATVESSAAETYGRVRSGRAAYESTPIKAYGGLTNSALKPRRDSYLGSLPASLFDEDTRIGRMHVPPVIRCECNGIASYALISTSETVSTMSMEFVRKLRLTDQIIPDTSQIFNPLALHQPELKGKVKYIDLTIGSWQQVAQFNIVENYISDITLGIDFLRRTQSIVNFEDSTVLVGGSKGERIPFLTSRDVMALSRRNSTRPNFIIANGFNESE